MVGNLQAFLKRRRVQAWCRVRAAPVEFLLSILEAMSIFAKPIANPRVSVFLLAAGSIIRRCLPKVWCRACLWILEGFRQREAAGFNVDRDPHYTARKVCVAFFQGHRLKGLMFHGGFRRSPTSPLQVAAQFSMFNPFFPSSGFTPPVRPVGWTRRRQNFALCGKCKKHNLYLAACPWSPQQS